MQVLHTYFLGSYANFKPSCRDKTTRPFLHESAAIPGGPGTRLQLQSISAPGSHEHETNLITAVVFTMVNVINNLLSVPGWRTKCFLTRRYNLPTKARLHFFSLSKSVLSIIHEMCSSPTLHTTQYVSHSIPLLPCIQVCWCGECFHAVARTSGLGGGVNASFHFT